MSILKLFKRKTVGAALIAAILCMGLSMPYEAGATSGKSDGTGTTVSAGTEDVTEAATEALTEAETEPVTETAAEAIAETETEPVTEAVEENETEAETEAVPEPQPLYPGQGIYQIGSLQWPQFLLDVQHSVPEGGAPQPTGVLQLYEDLQVNQQKFYVEVLAEGYYRISSMASGEVLTAVASEDGTYSVCLADLILPETPAEEESAEGEGAETGTDRTEEEESGGETEAMAIGTEETAAGEEAALAAADKSQIWRITQDAEGSWDICSADGKYLAIADSSAYNGSLLTLRGHWDNEGALWKGTPSQPGRAVAAETSLINPYAENGKLHDLHIWVRFGTEYAEVSAQELQDHMTVTEDHRYVVDDAFFTEAAQRMADKYDTQGVPRVFTDSYGHTFTLSKGNFGWKLNVSKTAEALKQAASQEDSAGLVFATAEWDHRGISFQKGDDIGNSYVEIDLTGQKVWLYKDGVQLLETDCVTGTYGTERQTPGGVYSIYYKQSPATLTGPDYSSYVNYWMPFNGGIGLHDAPWRGSFGGDIYKYNGSHGCINLPYDAAKLIYETVGKGYPVVCYN